MSLLHLVYSAEFEWNIRLLLSACIALQTLPCKTHYKIINSVKYLEKFLLCYTQFSSYWNLQIMTKYENTWDYGGHLTQTPHRMLFYFSRSIPSHITAEAHVMPSILVTCYCLARICSFILSVVSSLLNPLHLIFSDTTK